MNSSLSKTASQLQKGIAAARAGRSLEARQLLQQVVSADPHNEMAWLWLSGLMATSAEKRTCLERVIMANPQNAYARAGLERLNGEAEPVASAHPFDPTPSDTDAIFVPMPGETLCPVCDGPVSPADRVCPYCDMEFIPFEELLERGKKKPKAPARPVRRRHRGILGFLGAVILG